MAEGLRSLHDDPERQDIDSTARQEIALNGTYLRDVILSGFDKFSPRDFLEVTDVNARTSGYSEEASPSPGFFVQHHDLMDWAIRYNDDKPIKKPGDPKILLNKSQIRAIAQMISHRICVIQGVSTSHPFSGFHFRVSIYSRPIYSSLQELERRRRSSRRSDYSGSTSKCITRSWSAPIPMVL